MKHVAFFFYIMGLYAIFVFLEKEEEGKRELDLYLYGVQHSLFFWGGGGCVDGERKKEELVCNSIGI